MIINTINILGVLRLIISICKVNFSNWSTKIFVDCWN